MRASARVAGSSEPATIVDIDVAASERPSPVMAKPFLTTPLLPRFVVSGQRLGLCASKLSTDGCSNPQDSGIERYVVRRSLVVGRTRSLPTSSSAMPTPPRQDTSRSRQRIDRNGREVEALAPVQSAL